MRQWRCRADGRGPRPRAGGGALGLAGLAVSALLATAVPDLATATEDALIPPARATVNLGTYLAAPLAGNPEIATYHVTMRETALPQGYLTTDPNLAGYRHRQIECLALNVYFEARGEPADGQRAVAQVVMNRVADRDFPGTVCAVIQQRGKVARHLCQFSWWCDGRSDRPQNARAWRSSYRVAQAVYRERASDPTGGALWYHADHVSPAWREAFARGPKIGRHIFYRKATARTQAKALAPAPRKKPWQRAPLPVASAQWARQPTAEALVNAHGHGPAGRLHPGRRRSVELRLPGSEDSTG